MCQLNLLEADLTTDKMDKFAKISLLLGTIAIICAYQLHPYFYKGFFYHATAFSFVCFLHSLYRQAKGTWSLIAFVVLMLSINNCIDELFFDPTEVDLNEWVSFGIIVLIVYIERRKWIKL